MRRPIVSEETRSSIAAWAAQSFLRCEFSTARLGVLLSLRHAGVFQVNTMVHSGIRFQEPLTRPVVKLDEKMRICSSTPQDHGRYTNSSMLESYLRERKCHGIVCYSLRTCMNQMSSLLSVYPYMSESRLCY